MEGNYNKLIAEFMGYMVTDEGFFYPGQSKEIKRGHKLFDNFKYSWDWLIPVIKKINDKLNQDLFYSDFDRYRDFVEMNLNPVNRTFDQVYKSCVEFIKFYNDNYTD